MIQKLIALNMLLLLSSAPALAQDYEIEGSAEGEADTNVEASTDTTGSLETESSYASSTNDSSVDTSTTLNAGAQGSASDANGRLGIGYFTGAAPVGIRMWMDDNMGFDVGLGAAFGTEPTTTWAFAIEGGLLLGLHTWEHVRLFGRVGLGLGLADPGAGVSFNGNVNGLLGAEFFMAALGFPMLSFSGGIGAQLGFAKPDGADFGVTFGTAAADPNIVTSVGAQLGFHIYMP